MKIKLAIILFFSVFFSSSCTTKIDHLKQAVPVSSPYHTALATYYLEFSEKEAEQFDWLDSQYFAEKGLMVAKGASVNPEPVENWHISKASRASMLQAREYLVEVITDENQRKYPELLASTVFMFDCWMEQQEENWQVDDIQNCKENFYTNLDQLYGKIVVSEKQQLQQLAIKDHANQKKIKTASAESKQDNSTAQLQELYYETLFSFDQYSVNKAALQTLRSLFAELKKYHDKTIKITVNGHADRAGNKQYNMELSRKRADAIKALLLKEGIELSRIEALAFGESDPKVKTKDGVKHPKNRRVEIEVVIQ